MTNKDDEPNSTIPFTVTPLEAVNLDSIMNGKVEEMNVTEEQERETKTEDGYCVECSDQPAAVFCEQCTDGICNVTKIIVKSVLLICKLD